MEWKKAKWLVIAFLFAVNLFLSLNIADKYSKAQRTADGELSDALSLTSSLPGFTKDAFSVLPLYVYSFSSRRSVSAEHALARSLLNGEPECSEAGGGVTIYQIDEHRITFRRGGYTEGFTAAQDGGVKRLSSLLKQAGIKNTVQNDGIVFSYRGMTISNAGLSVRTENDSFSFSGMIPVSEGWTRNERSLSRGELILALANHVKEGGLGELKKVSVSYRLTSSGTQDAALIPIITAECENGALIMSMTDKTLIYSGN